MNRRFVELTAPNGDTVHVEAEAVTAMTTTDEGHTIISVVGNRFTVVEHLDVVLDLVNGQLR